VAILPYGTTVEEIAAASDEISPGVVSAGIGSVPVAQTYLDIGQGNRVNKSLYDTELPRLYVRDGQVPGRLWDRTLERAENAPANVVPGLLATTLIGAGVPVWAEADSGLATLIGVDGSGAVAIRPTEECTSGCGPGLSVLRTRRAEFPQLVASIDRSDEMLIAIAAGARTDQQLLPAGIAAAGLHGDLTSDSTRTDGVVSATDIAPTVLEHLGADVPDEMNGSRIRASGEPDAVGVADLQAKLADRPSREQVILIPLGAWLLLAAVASALGRRRAARIALPLLALSCAWAPLVLLAAAAVDAGEPVAGVMMGLGSVVLAVATRRLAPGYLGLALAAGATVVAHAIDVVVGSPLTALSVLGPNPGYGVRFFGIGNELEASLTTLTLIGAGAWLATRRALTPRATAAWFAAIAIVATAAFAPGRFGADVGAAIVLGAGGATAAVLALGLSWRHGLLVVIGGGVLGLAGLLVVDQLLGGAHLSRSVLGAGEAGDLADVVERRVSLMTDSFTDPVYPELLAASLVMLILGAVRHRTVLAWFDGREAARAGFLGALVGVLVGTFANDSGSVLLVIGSIYLGVCAGFFWAESERSAAPP
jgi:hypothetical protein